jgi:hypothetical protein
MKITRGKQPTAISKAQSPFDIACCSIAKFTPVTDVLLAPVIQFRCSGPFFLFISAIATSNARWRKFAQTDKGASWMTFPAIFY